MSRMIPILKVPSRFDFVLVLCVFMLGLPQGIVAAGPELDQARIIDRGADYAISSLGLAYLETSMQLYKQKKYTEATTYTDRALLLDPFSSDILYASVLFSGDTSRSSDIRKLEQALSENNFVRFAKEDAAILLAQRLLRSKLVQRAETMLTEEFSIAAILANPRLLSILLHVYDANSRQTQASALLERGLKIHPASLLLWSMQVQRSEFGPSTNARLVFKRADTGYESYEELAIAMADRLPNGAERLGVLEWLISSGKAKPRHLVFLSELEKSTGSSGAKWEELQVKKFIEKGGVQNREAILQLRSLLSEASAISQLQAAFSLGKSLVGSDKDFDGFNEESFLFETGQLKLWQRDENQDGEYDNTMKWLNNLPSELSFKAPFDTSGLWISLEYGNTYPNSPISVVHTKDVNWTFHHGARDNAEVYVDVPENLESIFDYLSLEFHTIEMPNFERLAHASYLVEASPNLDLTLDETTLFLYPGHPNPSRHGSISQQEDKPLVLPKSGQVRAQIALQEGWPVLARVDTTANGYFDKRYVFVDGRRAFGFWDLGIKGGQEVFEEYDSEGLALLRYAGKSWSYVANPSKGLAAWDLNGDGLLDTVEVRSGWQKSARQVFPYSD